MTHNRLEELMTLRAMVRFELLRAEAWMLRKSAVVRRIETELARLDSRLAPADSVSTRWSMENWSVWRMGERARLAAQLQKAEDDQQAASDQMVKTRARHDAIELMAARELRSTKQEAERRVLEEMAMMSATRPTFPDERCL